VVGVGGGGFGGGGGGFGRVRGVGGGMLVIGCWAWGGAGRLALRLCTLSLRRLLLGDETCFIFKRVFLVNYWVWISGGGRRSNGCIR